MSARDQLSPVLSGSVAVPKQSLCLDAGKDDDKDSDYEDSDDEGGDEDEHDDDASDSDYM